VDVNCIITVLLQSVKPALHVNVDCTSLVAAIVSRQISSVKCLLEVTSIFSFASVWFYFLLFESLRMLKCLKNR
jgi:hypothetical protein